MEPYVQHMGTSTSGRKSPSRMGSESASDLSSVGFCPDFLDFEGALWLCLTRPSFLPGNARPSSPQCSAQ